MCDPNGPPKETLTLGQVSEFLHGVCVTRAKRIDFP